MTPEIQRPSPPPELVEQARAYIASKQWRFASMMADMPHHYVVFPFGENGAERDHFLALRELIEKHGWNREWHGSTYRTYTLDGLDYWVIWPVINRVPADHQCDR